MDTAAIFQRTETGRDTIKTKAVKLTQSERLLLIIIDGATSYGVLRKEVWALSEERFDRALQTLLREGLVFEVLLPIQGQEAEELDSTVVDLFLQQDPLDPVTIISFDPEDEFGSDDNPITAPVKAILPEQSSVPVEAATVVEAVVAPSENAIAPVEVPLLNDDIDPVLASIPELSSSVTLQPSPELLMAGEGHTLPPLVQTSGAKHVFMLNAAPTANTQNEDWADNLPDNWPEHLLDDEPAGPAHTERVHWIYWLALGSGIVMLVVSLISRNLH